MDAKVGDRVSIDAKKVGQPRRVGVIRSVTKGISGVRYQVRWDDGHESMLSPGAGILTIEGRSSGGNSKRSETTRPKRTAAAATAKAAARKVVGKKAGTKKPTRRR